MPQSLAAVYLHVVFSTKNREPWLSDALAPRLYEYIGGVARGQGAAVVAAGGVADHIHVLASIGREVAIADLVRQVKASSSRWVHDTVPELKGIAWQAGYGAFSVSPSMVERVARYIAGQAEHHRTQSFQDEYRAILTKHGIAWSERYVWD